MINVRFLNPFIEAAAQILEMEVGAQVERGSISLARSAHTVREVSVVLSLMGQVQGLVVYGFSKQMALGLVEQMMGAPVEELDELAQSGIAELGNVITGRATMKLSQNGYESIISPPTLIIGENTRISTLDFPRLAIPLKTQYGDMEVHLGLRETESVNQESQRIPASAG